MKRKLVNTLVLVLMFSGMNTFAQNVDNKWAFNLSGNLSQYDGDLGNEILSLGTFGLAVGPERYLNKSFNGYFSVGIDGVSYEEFERGFFDTQMGLNYKLNNGYLFSEDSKVKPYLTAGVGMVFASGAEFFNIPLGAGFRVNLKEGVDLRVAGVYNKVVAHSYSYFQNTIGLVLYNGGKKKVKDSDGDGIDDLNDDCPSIAGVASNNGCPPPADADGDGVLDEDDRCPQVAGSSSFGGCPDSDKDGIEDSKDNCPNLRGPVATGGCPDADGDGIKDTDDACPRVAGTAATNGCPDSDNDGIVDSEDKCPNEAGVTSNKGCPELDDESKRILAEALEGVQFESGRGIIKRSSYVKLDKVVGLMQLHKEFKLKISGYTDNTGNADSNLKLSDVRAKAAMQYIVDKGIDASRITAQGYGIANPIEDNATAAGRAKNRRVEFEVVF